MHELLLAGHSASVASSCDLSISVPVSTAESALDVQTLQGMEQTQFRGLCSDGNSCDDSSFFPAPTKFRKKSGAGDCSNKYTSDSVSCLETKRAVRRAMGLVIVKNESANWESCAEVRQISVSNASKGYLTSDPVK
jgi:hypothetical protein